MTEERRESDFLIHQLDNRLAVLEREMERIVQARVTQNRWLLSLVILSVGYILTGVYGFSRLEATVTNMNLGSMEQNIAVALGVLKDHGTEIGAVESEQARIRGAHDLFHIQIENIRADLAKRTQSRWYREDGLENRRRIERLENLIDGSLHDGSNSNKESSP